MTLTPSTPGVLKIFEAVRNSERIDFDQAMELYENADLYDLAALADSIRRKKHPEGMVTFVSDRNINYSNICVCCCKFCAFYRSPESGEGYVISREELSQKIQETIDLGGT